jgi:hypothetical protein
VICRSRIARPSGLGFSDQRCRRTLPGRDIGLNDAIRKDRRKMPEARSASKPIRRKSRPQSVRPNARSMIVHGQKTKDSAGALCWAKAAVKAAVQASVVSKAPRLLGVRTFLSHLSCDVWGNSIGDTTSTTGRPDHR